MNKAEILKNFEKKLKKTKSIKGANDLLIEYIGKRGFLKQYIGDYKELKMINKEIRLKIEKKKQWIDSQEDLSLNITIPKGKRHKLREFTQYLISVGKKIGFVQQNHDHITSVFYNFDSLGVEKGHPARSEEQTFYIQGKNTPLLRTQTSVVQNEAIKAGIPKVFSIGAVYRRDSSSRHLPMFHQMEFMSLGKEENFQALKTHVKRFLGEIFQRETSIRFRPSFFPFTHISYEVDIFFNNEWLEVLGCGIISEKVFEKAGKKLETGWAMGCGVERLLMIRDQIKDIRDFYKLNI